MGLFKKKKVPSIRKNSTEKVRNNVDNDSTNIYTVCNASSEGSEISYKGIKSRSKRYKLRKRSSSATGISSMEWLKQELNQVRTTE